MMNYHSGKCRTDSTCLKFVIDYYTDRLLKNRTNYKNSKAFDGEDGGDGGDGVDGGDGEDGGDGVDGEDGDLAEINSTSGPLPLARGGLGWGPRDVAQATSRPLFKGLYGGWRNLFFVNSDRTSRGPSTHPFLLQGIACKRTPP
ncbi:hypothetical protein NG796_15535 [Laspinema sp. A4]|uniref:hypothetical protein n=1 Tax=Laspinema sp. D2d TaxID=2953686 RepID=UPI0021BAC3C5|nr:hypothetical protein [Laspinema sp. D2d]MCT7984710.1 hypothetical protein [Laspinema sp. D2d]